MIAAAPSVAFRKLLLARRRLGSWQEVGRRLRRYLTTEGLATTMLRIRTYGVSLPGMTADDIIPQRYAEIRADIRDRIAARPPRPAGSQDIDDGPLISVVMPVFRAPLGLLDKAIGSVLRQSYPRWELCIVDDGSGQPALVDRLRRHAAREPRIKLQIATANSGIAAASNQAIALATGSYVGFLDNDDVLTNDALYWIARTLVDAPDTDIAYSDECKIDDIDGPDEIFNKPDWSPALLFNSMYFGHLTVYRRSLIDALGGLRSQFDFSQDYDLALRAVERTSAIRHVDRVLYCWRMVHGSAAAGGKPYARQSNIAALQDALDRRGYPAEAVPLPSANYARWQRDALRGKVSIVVPSDDAGLIRDSVRSIGDHTTYADYEVIVVCRTSIMQALAAELAEVRFVAFDAPFNFSTKCNVGAAAASGEYVIFFNDDVRVTTGDWIEVLLECLRIDGVGAAAPKLLYENGTIQHAGMVTGVRRLVGTAFHCLPGNTSAYFNLAQSMREVSILSAACVAMPLALFRSIGGFDDVNTPIGHSDIDLSFRVREAGYRCLYTPHATLLHIGHQSLAAFDSAAPVKKDKADIYLLRRFPEYTAYDPYYPPHMKALVFADSPVDFEIHPARTTCREDGLDILILCHDLTNSGAPLVAFNIARVLTAAGHFVVVMSPTDGVYRSAFMKLGVTVIIEPLLAKRHDSVRDFARNFDRVIVNTVVLWPAVWQLARSAKVYWYVHESQIIADEFIYRADFVRAVHSPAKIWVVSKRTASFLASDRDDLALVEVGIDPPQLAPSDRAASHFADGPTEFVVIGSYEPRKGQDLAVAAIKLLPPSIRACCRFRFYGRVLDQKFHADVMATAAGIPEITIGGELSRADCLQEMNDADVILCPSRDDSFSLVGLEALALGKVLVCTRTTGASDYVEHLKSGIVIADGTVPAISDAIIECLEMRSEWPEIGRHGREVFLGHFSFEAFAERIITQLAL